MDFGADLPFTEVQAKLLEHHGVEVAVSTLRQVTPCHGEALCERQILPKAAKGKATVLIAEVDGSMIPTVQCGKEAGKTDRRKCRELSWKEARLSLVSRAEAVSPVFAVTLGAPEEVG